MALPRFFTSLPRVTRALLVANFAVFLLQVVTRARFDAFALWPIGGEALDSSAWSFMPWQLVTYSFLHGDFGHVFFNMLAVLMFGAMLEHTWGERRFATYWFACVIGAGVCQLAVSSWMLAEQNILSVAVGASGGVYGLVLAFGMKFPHQRIAIFPLPMLLTARTVAIAYAAIALFYGVFGSSDGVAHFAHLGGMLAGWLVLRHRSGDPPFGKRKPKVPRIRIVR